MVNNIIKTTDISNEDLITIFEIARHAIEIDCEHRLADELDISDEEWERIQRAIIKALN